jgi:hypothetical protein
MGCHLHTEQNRSDVLIPLAIGIFGEAEWDRVSADSKRVAKGIKKMVPKIAAHYRAEHLRMLRCRDSGHMGRLEFQGWSATLGDGQK